MKNDMISLSLLKKKHTFVLNDNLVIDYCFLLQNITITVDHLLYVTADTF